MKKILPCLMFLLIFAPKVGGSIDSMSFFCLVTLLASFFVDRRLDFPKNIINPTLLYLFFGFAMLGYVTIIKATLGVNDNYQLLRFGRVIVNVLGIFGLVRLYRFFYNDSYASKMLYHLWCCIICHAILMISMFLIPSVNRFVITQLVQLDEANRSFETRIEGQRIGGLTNTWDAVSGIQSLGILLLPFAFQYFRANDLNKRWVYFSIPISLCAILISGVTGIVNIILVSFVLIIFNFNILKAYFSTFFKVLTLAFILIVGFVFVANVFSFSDKDWVRNTSIGRTLFMITQDKSFYAKADRGITADETVDKISKKMYFIPENDISFFIGRGGSGRSQDYVIKADPGPTLNLHNLGIFFVLATYGYCLSILLKSLRFCKQNLFVGIALSSVLLTIMIIDAKVMYLLARQSLSIMLIAYFILFGVTNRTFNTLKI